MLNHKIFPFGIENCISNLLLMMYYVPINLAFMVSTICAREMIILDSGQHISYLVIRAGKRNLTDGESRNGTREPDLPVVLCPVPPGKSESTGHSKSVARSGRHRTAESRARSES